MGAKMPGRFGLPVALLAAACMLTRAINVLVLATPAIATPLPPHPVTLLGRTWDSWAYDPAEHEIVMFGGSSAPGSGSVYGGTWTWNGRAGAWAEQHPARSPSPRTGAAMVWDPATRQLLLFGGSQLAGTAGGFLDGTWTWDGQTWRRLHPADSPSARHNADMFYDGAMHEVILFGGYNGAYLRDTWAWNGQTWRQLHPAASPSARDTESLVYDPDSRTAIMYGGLSASRGRLSDTWSWNGTTWTRLHPATSPGAVGAAWQAAYDGASHQVILFGGDAGDYSQDTWIWTGWTWQLLHPSAFPIPRAYGAMTYDRPLQRVVLFGGINAITDPVNLWEWNGVTWQKLPQPAAADPPATSAGNGDTIRQPPANMLR